MQPWPNFFVIGQCIGSPKPRTRRTMKCLSCGLAFDMTWKQVVWRQVGVPEVLPLSHNDFKSSPVDSSSLKCWTWPSFYCQGRTNNQSVFYVGRFFNLKSRISFFIISTRNITAFLTAESKTIIADPFMFNELPALSRSYYFQMKRRRITCPPSADWTDLKTLK